MSQKGIFQNYMNTLPVAVQGYHHSQPVSSQELLDVLVFYR